jgi:hypothetical protein
MQQWCWIIFSVGNTMHQKIRELYCEAFGHVPSPIGEPELEKFAALIIRECLILTYEHETQHYQTHNVASARVIEQYRAALIDRFPTCLQHLKQHTKDHK